MDGSRSLDAAALDPLAIGKLMVDQVWAEGAGMEQAARAGLVKIHGTPRGGLLVAFLDVPWN